ncbi:DUF19 domain-containing protein [Trichonephila clavata]|uniref:DUF19 domain-containing protein n=1 Tax=Trichonephila clavata TaxID=2740835 RepID=A0A8X6HFL4_TRICU|nr:DUF19 domain-containing protein [Trichonephila clavata]
MQLKFLFLFIALAFAHAQNLEGECEEKAGECLGKFLVAVLGDTSEEEACSEFNDVINCLQEFVDECVGEEKDDEIDQKLQELRNLIADNCPDVAEEVDNDIKECVQKIDDEIVECLGEGISQVMSSALESPNEVDEDSIKCSLYKSVLNCVAEQVRKNCGIEGAKKTLESMMDIPDEIKESCSEPPTKDLIEALFDRRKK